jgi:GGDEF domain-containing protein
VSTPTLQSLMPLVDRRFQSFAEATDAALAALAAWVPGCIVLSQIGDDADFCRVLDSRGSNFAGTERGMIMPLDGDRVERSFLTSAGVNDLASVAVELNAGVIAGVLMAISPEEDSFGPEHRMMLVVAARVLGGEWERVRSRAELRTLRQQVRDSDQYDSETAVRNRICFEKLLDREWQLAQRGTVPSTVVAIHIEMTSDELDGATALKHLAIKDAAEVLNSVARNTDHVGRLDEWTLGVVMIGCDDESGVTPLMGRYCDALRRATESRAFELHVSSASHRLVESPSSKEALEAAEATAREQQGATPVISGHPEMG